VNGELQQFEKNGFEGLFALLNLNRRDRITIDGEFNWKFMRLIIDGKFCIAIVIRRLQYLIAICIRLCWVLNDKPKISENHYRGNSATSILGIQIFLMGIEIFCVGLLFVRMNRIFHPKL
jgi:hypothetical protein